MSRPSDPSPKKPAQASAGAPAAPGAATGEAATLSDLEARTAFSGDTAALTVGGYFQAYRNRVRGGDYGSLPALAGLIVLVIVFAGLRFDTFTSAGNFANLLQQAGSITVLAMGIGFVLLLGEIDLSAGVIGGVGAAVSAQLLANTSLPWWVSILAALGVGVLMGLLTGFLVSIVGIPSFVVTLAFFLAWQGVLLGIASQGGSIDYRSNNTIRQISNGALSVGLSWALVIVAILAWAGFSAYQWNVRRTKGLANIPLGAIMIKIGIVALLMVLATAYLSVNRGQFGGKVVGIPLLVPIIAVLLIVWTFVQSRTRFGRYVYAIGGNKEAARRAGIRVTGIVIACFVISSGMAILSGVIEGSRIGSVTASSGTGNQLLFAVAAAVIGGTSLFGGKGRARDAIIGGLVIALIPNGLGLITESSVWTYIITGVVLLLAASVDAITRRQRASSGR